MCLFPFVSPFLAQLAILLPSNNNYDHDLDDLDDDHDDDHDISMCLQSLHSQVNDDTNHDHGDDTHDADADELQASSGASVSPEACDGVPSCVKEGSQKGYCSQHLCCQLLILARSILVLF